MPCAIMPEMGMYGRVVTQYDFHPLRLCSCGQCGDGDLRCKRKGYETRNVVTSLARHKGKEQQARQELGKFQKILHTNWHKDSIGTPVSSPKTSPACTPTRPTSERRKCHTNPVVKPYKCGSASHSRKNHSDCPYNKSKKAVAVIVPTVATVCSESDDGANESMYSDDERGIETDYEGTLSYSDEDIIILCLCWSCPRNRGAHPAKSSNTSTIGQPTLSSDLKCSHASPTQYNHSSEDNKVQHSANVLSSSGPAKFNVCEDVVCVGTSSCTVVHPSGPLPSPEWKSNVSTVLKQWSGLSLITKPEPVKTTITCSCPEILPHICDSIVGDGNCLFRALSKEVTGTRSPKERSTLYYMQAYPLVHLALEKLNDCLHRKSGTHGSESLCRDGAKTRWWLQWMY